jgi:hypothetical protein
MVFDSGNDPRAALAPDDHAHKPTALYLFSGIGGGSLGFRDAGFRGVGAFDLDAAACRDYEALVGEPATCKDLGARRASTPSSPGPTGTRTCAD